ncbi:MAG: MarR family transcriptional regulator [Pseudomonadota bacterium]
MLETEIALLIDRFMRRTHAGVHGRAKILDTDNIGPGGGMMLLTLAEIEPAPIHDLVAELARDKAQITRAVQTLEKKGLIRRSVDGGDGRVSILRLTPKGSKFVAGLQIILTETIGELLSPLTGAEREALKSLLVRAMDKPSHLATAHDKTTAKPGQSGKRGAQRLPLPGA